MIKTRNEPGAYRQFPEETISAAASHPPAFLEYTWYVSLIYAYLGQVWGVVIPAVGGVLLAVLAVGCFLSVSEQALRVYKPVAWALCTGILVMVIDLLFHKQTEGALREGILFVTWLEMLIVVQSLSLRPRFLQRFALVALAIGVACVPYINVRDVGKGVARAWAVGTGLSNGNALGTWFGFCTVYFVFWGFQAQRSILRSASWAVAAFCLFIVTLSVSRGPLIGIILACIVGFHSALKRSFVPLLMLVLMMSLIYISGVFDEQIDYYISRGAEESGREKLFVSALERILDSPWIGVGLGETRIPKAGGRWHNPHNSFLYIVLAAGILPLICFLRYLVRVGIGALRIMRRVHVGEAAILPPLIAFALFQMMLGHYTFMSPWTVVVCGLAAGAGRSMATEDR